MASELLLEASLALTGAIVLVMALRAAVRRLFGATAAYALWWLVPAALLAVALPAAPVPVMPVLVSATAVPIEGAGAAVVAATTGIDLQAWLAPLWLAGALAMLGWQLWLQRRFHAGLGPLTRRPDGHYQALATRGLPAVVGLRPRIVLPGDFEQRYEPIERELVLAHERVHLERADLPACALAALLRTLFWFHPLVHLALPRFRQDQELACDAVVVRRHPAHRRHYGDAMLKTRLADQALPLGCHWSGLDPLKERIAMLKQPLPSPARQSAGLVLALLLGLAAAAMAWAAQPAASGDQAIPAGKLRMALLVKVDGEQARSTRPVLSPGQAHREDFEHAGQAWETTWTVTPLADGTFDVQARLVRDGEVVGEPRMITREAAAIGIGEQQPDGGFKGIEIELAFTAGPPPAGMAAIGIEGEVPAYPEAAAAAGEGGMVMLRVLVGTDGSAREVHYVPEQSTVPADAEITRNTLQAARGWKFSPAIKDGQPVEGWVLVPVKFEPPSPEA